MIMIIHIDYIYWNLGTPPYATPYGDTLSTLFSLNKQLFKKVYTKSCSRV